MEKPWFDLQLKPEVMRGMNREQYYAARSWLRMVRRQILKQPIFERNMRELA